MKIIVDKVENNGIFMRRLYYNPGYTLHDEDKPSEIVYQLEGDKELIMMEGWYLNNELGRKNNEPHIIYYYSDRQDIQRKEQWYKNNKVHKEDGPASIEYDRNNKIFSQVWALDGQYFTNQDKWQREVLIRKIAGIE